MASVKGGRGVTGISYSGKSNLEKPSVQSVASGKVNKEREGWGPGMLAQTPPGTTSRSLMQKFSTVPGDYAAYRKSLPGFANVMKGKKPSVLAPVVVAKKTVKPAVKPAAQVIRTTTSEKLSPAPARMAVNARTGNTTGFTTGKTTGTSASKPGVAGRTAQSAYGRQMANAMNRTNQPAGPMGGGGGRMGGGGGGGRSGGSLSGGGSGGRQAGTSRTGGTRTNEPAGPKRG